MPEIVPSVAVVIPCFRVSRQVQDVIARIGPEVRTIFVVDDACPEHTGDCVERNCADARVTVIRHAENQGVGGAMVTGYRAALASGADIVVKIDGDGQMDPALIPRFVRALAQGQADRAADQPNANNGHAAQPFHESLPPAVRERNNQLF
jgi:glycosyltransferase involved in cell wall biosynthesis